MRRMLPLPAGYRDFDWSRSTGLAVAVFGNAILLIVLSLPRSTEFNPWLPPAPAPAPEIPEVITRAEPVAFAPPPKWPQLPPRPLAASTRTDSAAVPLPVARWVEAEASPGSNAAEAEPMTATTVASAETGATAAVAYRHAPPPEYPGLAKRRGQQGTVVLRVLVDPQGRPTEVQVEHSSGYRELDRAAQQQVVQRWSFVPALRDGQPISAWVRVPLQFSLRGG